MCLYLREIVVISRHKNEHPWKNEEVTIAVSTLFRSLTTEAEARNKLDLQSKYNFYSWVQPVVFLKEIYFSLHCEKHELAFFRTLRIKHGYHKSIEKKELILSSSHRWCSESKGHVTNAQISNLWGSSLIHIFLHICLYFSRRQDSSNGSSMWWEY